MIPAWWIRESSIQSLLDDDDINWIAVILANSAKWVKYWSTIYKNNLISWDYLSYLISSKINSKQITTSISKEINYSSIPIRIWRNFIWFYDNKDLINWLIHNDNVSWAYCMFNGDFVNVISTDDLSSCYNWNSASVLIRSGSAFIYTTNSTSCVSTNWIPALSTVCSWKSFTQTSNCWNTKASIWSKNCAILWQCASKYSLSNASSKTKPTGTLCSAGDVNWLDSSASSWFWTWICKWNITSNNSVICKSKKLKVNDAVCWIQHWQTEDSAYINKPLDINACSVWLLTNPNNNSSSAGIQSFSASYAWYCYWENWWEWIRCSVWRKYTNKFYKLKSKWLNQNVSYNRGQACRSWYSQGPWWWCYKNCQDWFKMIRWWKCTKTLSEIDLNIKKINTRKCEDNLNAKSKSKIVCEKLWLIYKSCTLNFVWDWYYITWAMPVRATKTNKTWIWAYNSSTNIHFTKEQCNSMYDCEMKIWKYFTATSEYKSGSGLMYTWKGNWTIKVTPLCLQK